MGLAAMRQRGDAKAAVQSAKSDHCLSSMPSLAISASGIIIYALDIHAGGCWQVRTATAISRSSFPLSAAVLIICVHFHASPAFFGAGSKPQAEQISAAADRHHSAKDLPDKEQIHFQSYLQLTIVAAPRRSPYIFTSLVAVTREEFANRH